MTLTFTIINPDDDPINFTLDFLPKIGAYEFCENPGFVNTNATVGGIPGFGGYSAELWQMTGIAIPAYGTTVFTARVKVVGAVTPLYRSIATRGTSGGVTGGFVTLPSIDPVYDAVIIGVDPSSVTTLSLLPTGGINQLPAPPGNTGRDVIINGKFNVDVDYTFSSLTRIYMAPGSSINVTADFFTLMDKTTIRACDQPWKGIDVQQGATLILDGVSGANGDVNIMDAEIAVEANAPLAAVGAHGVKFKNNGIGISSSGGTGWYFDIEDNLFTADDHAQLTAIAGVRANNMSQNLTILRNKFENSSFGIWGTNTTLSVYQNTFNAISDIGILAECDNNSLRWLSQEGLGQNNASFKDCFMGIGVINMEVSAQNNLMEEVNRGISLRQGIFKDALIIDNTIHAERIGISVNNWTPRTKYNRFRVENNTVAIDGNSSEGAGIWLENLNTNRDSRVYNNTINLNDARYGIYCNTLTGTLLADNLINMNKSQTMEGINLENVFSNDVYCNGINGSDINAEQDGIRVATSSNVVLNCNTSDNTERAIHYDGQNLPIRMISNFFNTHNRAVQYEAGTLTGVQSHHGNRWLTDLQIPNFGVWHKGSDIDINGCKILFDGNDEPVPGQVQLRCSEDTSQPISIFTDQLGNTLSCVTASCPPSLEGFTDPGNDADATVAAGNYVPSGSYPNAQAWVAKRQLYRRLLATPDLLTSSASNQNFFNTNANTTVGKFSGVLAAMDAMNTMSANTQSQLDSNQTSLDAKLDDLTAVDAQLADNPTPQQQASLAAQQQTLRGDISNLQSAQDGLLQSVLSDRQSTANQWLTTNNAINAVEEFELMQQQVNAIALANIVNGATELTPTQQSTLSAIANTCPYRGGAVSIINLTGQTVLQEKLATETTSLQLNTSTLPNGIYFVLSSDKLNASTISQRLVILR
ncbi:MAG: T9SS type A sorting domain-containing protein [Saprospiraceae bacterium]|nr:T9SS type A sorting domain-containing protein [Saprospiraceae bacterium]MCF8249518.1 T9SS type A sorting domain-containing protein [Saprospiraceae bacterium]MCF8280143.1 T9SS type A sorting domain-containing protein [Bacteroidales bacterium]MCF8310736.1 T9SS type A sorting domain-containing protein [Saprospiraceae bacterium]MCF8439433.1 T9SS type A sorting domain-containing protein [Saprospiraceae bacterium]